MHNSTQYRTFADECRRLAKAAKTAHERIVLEEMAATWQLLADDADRTKVRSDS